MVAPGRDFAVTSRAGVVVLFSSNPVVTDLGED